MYPNLRIQMWKCGVRQNQLARMLGMHETALSKIVNGFRKPDEATRGHIARLLNCEEGWLFEWSEGIETSARAARAGEANAR